MRAEKQLLLDDICAQIDQAQAFVITRYNKIDPNMAAQLRGLVCESGGEMEVVRKRIFIKAAQAAGIVVDPSMLEGHIAVVFAKQDPLQTTKAVFKFRQDNEDVLEIVGGRFEGKIYTAKDVEQLSKLPNKLEMQAQFLGLLEAVPAQMLGVLDALLSSVVHCLDNKSKT